MLLLFQCLYNIYRAHLWRINMWAWDSSIKNIINETLPGAIWLGLHSNPSSMWRGWLAKTIVSVWACAILYISTNFKLTYWPCLELASVILTNYISSIPLLLIMESLPEVLSFVVSKALMSKTPGKQLSWSNGDIIGMKLVWKPEKPPHNLGHRSPTVYVNVHASHSQAPSHLPS